MESEKKEHIHISSEIDDENEYLKNYEKQKGDYKVPAVAVDLLIFTIKDDKLQIVLSTKQNQPFKDMLALPGVFCGYDESLDIAVERCLQKEVGALSAYFEQLYTFGNDVNRDPRMRVFSVAYFAFLNADELEGRLLPISDLYDVDEILNSDIKLAFDHKKIIQVARQRIKERVQHSTIAFDLLPKQFTLPKLQRVYEILMEKKLYKTNFRAKVMSLVSDTGVKTEGDAFRPSIIYEKNNDIEMPDAQKSFKDVDDIPER